jgi:hypothetical protein
LQILKLTVSCYIVSPFYTKHSRHVHTTNPLLYFVVSYISVAERFAI